MARTLVVFAVALSIFGCDDDGTEADFLGVGAECSASDECDVDDGQECLPEFSGGYCGIRDCSSDLDCPEASGCVAHTDGVNYCFRTCLDKSECNVNRSVENESNCSSNITFTDGTTGVKACVPPSSGL